MTGQTIWRRMARVTATGTLIAAAGVAGTLASGGAAIASPMVRLAAPAWRIQATPEPSGTSDQAFSAVSCSSSSACQALAGDDLPHGDTGQFAETWNGSQWTVRTLPQGQDSAMQEVSCVTASWCDAVGSITTSATGYAPVADHWNGKSWTQSRLPVPAGATATSLESVSCSATTACTAIGSSAKGSGAPALLAEHWNGSAWTVQPIPAPAGGGASLSAVSCTAANLCRAVGSDNAGLFAEVWNGSTWLVEPVPAPAGSSFAGLTGVSCPAADSCEAVGSYSAGGSFHPLAEAWNGSKWSLQAPVSAPGESFTALHAVSCVSASDCEAAGDAGPASGSQEAGVLEKWNGSTWSFQEKVLPAGDQNARLNGISCTAGPVCESVGFAGHSVTTDHLLALRYSS